MSNVAEIAKELISTLTRLAALDARTADVAANQARIDTKLDTLIDRLARVEADYSHLRPCVKSEIMGDLKADLARTQTILDLQTKGLWPTAPMLDRSNPHMEAPKLNEREDGPTAVSAEQRE